MSPIEVNLQPTDVADEEQLFFLRDEEDESGQEIFVTKALSKQRAVDDHEKGLSTKVTEVIKIPLNSAVYTFEAINENAQELNYGYITKNITSISSKQNHEEKTCYDTKKGSS